MQTTKMTHNMEEGDTPRSTWDVNVSPSVGPSSSHVTDQLLARIKARKNNRFTARQLVYSAEKLLESYQFNQLPGETPDAHADIFLPEYPVTHPHDIIFLKQVLYGCCRYEPLIKAFVKQFFDTKMGEVNFADHTKYKIFAYLLFVRLEELTFKLFSVFVNSQDAQKMLPFLAFIFEENGLQNIVKEHWLKHYDLEYINLLIEGIFVWHEEFLDLIQRQHEKIEIKEGGRRYKPTVPEPFIFSEIRPRAQHAPRPLTPPFRAHRCPPKWVGLPKERLGLPAIFAENRRKQEEYYARYPEFHLWALHRPSKLDTIREEVEQKFHEEHVYIPTVQHPIPEPSTKEIYLTTSTLLREAAWHQRRRDEDAAKIEAIRVELQDDAELRHAQKEQRILEEEYASISRQFLKASVIETEHNANIARLAMEEENREIAEAVRREHKRLDLMKIEDEFTEVMVKKIQCEKVIEDRPKIKVAREKVVEEKKEKWKKIIKETKDVAQQVAVERARDDQYKKDLIRQLRAVELESCHYPKEIPLWNYTHGYGFLSEISMAQAQYQYKMWKENEKTLEDMRREEIHLKHDSRREMLMGKGIFVHRMRLLAIAKGTARREAEQLGKNSNKRAAEALVQQEIQAALMHPRIRTRKSIT